MARHLLLICLAPLLALTACIETHSEYTLNPDGSGKVVHSLKAAGMDKLLRSAIGDPETQEAFARETARRIVRGTQGVDTWSDISYGLNEDGTLFFNGTAYFPDLNKLKLTEGDDRDQYPPLPEPTFEEADGKMTLTIKQGTHRQQDVDLEKPVPQEADIVARLEKHRREWEQAKLMIGDLPALLTMTLIINVPGTIESVSNFQENTESQLGLTISGTQIVEALDALLQDDATARQIAEQDASGTLLNFAEPPIDPTMLNERLFGAAGPLEAVILPSEALFDYTGELTTAKANASQELEQLEE